MRTRLVSVIGSGGKATQEMMAQAEELGAALVREGYGIVCGGLGGVMEAVCRGAVRERGKERHPALIGLLPSYDVETGNDYLDIVLPTGMGHPALLDAVIGRGQEPAGRLDLAKNDLQALGEGCHQTDVVGSHRGALGCRIRAIVLSYEF